jgi:hypothetical protein
MHVIQFVRFGNPSELYLKGREPIGSRRLFI